MQRSAAVNAFLLIWVVYTLVLATAVAFTDQMALHLLMHPFHSIGVDHFFSVLTHVADGWVPTALSLLLLLVKDVRSFLMMGLSCGLSAIVVQILKHVLAHDRPSMFKEELIGLHWVEGLELHHHLSFPSGHSTAAFSMCFAAVVLIGGRVSGLVLGCVAAVLAYSRVYLSQHFTEDILAGAGIGTITGWLVYRMLYHGAFASKEWLSKKPLLT